MPATVSHALSMTTPDDPAYENKPSNWNSGHLVTFSVAASEISGLFSNANGVSFGSSGASITGSVNTSYLGSNASTNYVQANAVFNGTNASGTIASNALSISVATTYLASNASTNFVQASAGFNGTNVSGTIGSNSISLSVNAPATLMEFNPLQQTAFQTNAVLGQNSLYFVPFDVVEAVSAYRINFFLSVATTLQASNSTGSAGYTLSAALYSRPAASTDQINTFWSCSAFISMAFSSNTALSITHPAGISNSTAVSTNGSNQNNANASTYLQSSVAGFRVLPMPISMTLTPGRYWMAAANSSSSANGIGIINCSVGQTNYASQIAWRPFMTSSAGNNASFYAAIPGLGTYNGTSGVFPATVPLSSDSIRLPTPGIAPYFNFSGYTTGVNGL